MIRAEKITLVPLKRRHLEHLRFLRSDPQTYINLGSVVPINEEGQLEWFRQVSLDPNKMCFAVCKPRGKFIGFVRCDEWDKINGSIRIGVDIIPKERRKGYATQTYQALLSYLFLELHIHRVWLLVAEFNEPAKALYQKLGFREEGAQRDALFRHGKYWKYSMMSLLAEEYETKK